ncbi:MAG TPA: preprotein translocase subunit SecG [Clostridiales bacterium]|nr:preprotein translocase subunit SecG [Clostridiales bacterium]
MEIFLMIVDVLICLGLIVVILMQSSKSTGVSGVIGGASEQFFGKKKGLDALFARVSAILAVAFFVLTLIIAIVF